MPNRIIREGWIDSEAINCLTPEAESFFLRLCLKADDFGRFDGRLMLIRSALYPVKPGITDNHVGKLLNECVGAKLVQLYTVANKPYLLIHNFNQRTRSNKSKFPAPPDGQMTVICQSNDGHMSDTCQTSAHVFGDGDVVECGDGAARSKRFAPPSLDEVKLAAAKTGLSPQEAEKFWNYHEARGWMMGRNKMKSWPHALATWKINAQTYANNGKPNHQSIDRNAGTANAGLASMYDIDTNAAR